MSICFKDFTFRYNSLKKPTLKNINLEIKQGEKVLIAGPSGSGKSTLVHCINGLIPIAYKGHIEGSLTINNNKLEGKSLHEISKEVGTILQDSDGQFVALSVGEDVAFALENDNVPREKMRSRVDIILDKLGMKKFKNQGPGSLSGGQKQKVSMAGILAMEAPVLLFDEPLANLDPVSGQNGMKTISKLHKEQNKTVIVIEHRIEDVLEHDFDRIIIMSRGEVIFNGTPDEALRQDQLTKHGLREPLYIETLKKFNIALGEEKELTKIDTLKKYKNDVITLLAKEDAGVQKESCNELIRVENLVYSYARGENPILKGLDFTIKEAEFLAVLGNNGAGKSTLLKTLTGFVKVEHGDILYKGRSIKKDSIKKRAELIGYVMQNPNHMITQYMIFDEVALALRNRGMSEEEIKDRVYHALDVCGLSSFKKWPVEALSYGQKKRVTIASILALRPEVIVLDEPTAGQDYKNYTEFMDFLASLKKQGVTVVMITHDIQLALEYADRSIVLSSGEIIKEGTIYDVLSDVEVLKQADLKPTSISALSRLYEIDNESEFLESVVKIKKKDKEEVC